MMRSNLKYTFLLFISSILFTISSTQNLFGEDEEPDDNAPLYIPGKCPQNQLLYKVSDDESVDRVCDCGPGFIYYGAKDTCYEAYRQGPCRPNEYLALMKPSNQVMCVRNPCKKDEMVPFKNRCYKLHGTNGCPKKKDVQGKLSVNSTTLQIQCLYSNEVAGLNLITVNSCPPGSKRIATGQCRKPTDVS